MIENQRIKIIKELLQTEPEEVGFDSEKLMDMDNLFLGLIEKKKLQSASYLIARNCKIIACRSMGKLTYKEDSLDFMPDSIRRIASMTKMFTALAIMQLIEKGKLSLYQTVATILDEFNTSMHKDIALFHLLTHTSGIAADGGYFNEPYPSDRWNYNSEEGWIKQALAGPTQCKPGEACNYSSSGFMILGEIISRVSGIPYEEYIIKNILNPMGMKNTFFDVPEELKSRVCFTSKWAEERLYLKEDITGRPPRSGGGLYSTLEDLWKFGQMFLNNGIFDGSRIISRKSIEIMTENHLHNVPAFCWGANIKDNKSGLGLSIMSIHDTLTSIETFGHEGAGRCAIYIDPKEQLLSVYFVPTEVAWVPESIINPRNIIWSGII